MPFGMVLGLVVRNCAMVAGAWPAKRLLGGGPPSVDPRSFLRLAENAAG